MYALCNYIVDKINVFVISKQNEQNMLVLIHDCLFRSYTFDLIVLYADCRRTLIFFIPSNYIYIIIIYYYIRF